MDNKNYSSDSPICEQDKDRFSRWNFSERIAQVISRRSDPSSIVIGLYGIWGDGKTSVLNFIEKSLLDDENVICIKFNPWRFGAEDQLLSGFFFNIADALDAELITKGDKLKDFLKKAAPVAGAAFGVDSAGDAVGSFFSGPDINELKKRIEAALELAKKRVLILIDDVDRLEKSEIQALFRLVKLTADFKYTSYILAFDKDVVAASLQDRYSSSAENAGEAFLEKIIQVPLHLPAVEKQILREFCFQGVNEALEIADIKLTQQQVQEFVRDFSGAFDDCLTTPRKAKLYGNILMFSLPILHGEVNPVDLMLIEAIRVFCPSLYEVLRANKSLFCGVFSDSQYSNNDQEKQLIKTIVDEALTAGKNISKEGFINLLKNMFPKLQSVYDGMNYGSEWYEIWNKDQRACSEGYYQRYFSYGIPKNDISDRVLQKLTAECENWKEPFESERNPLNEILTSASSEILIRKLRSTAGEMSREASISLALAVCQKSDDIPNPEVLYSWTTQFSQAAMLVSSLIQNLDKAQRVDLAKACINFSPSIEFKLKIFQWLKREDEKKPEIEAFSEPNINDVGKYLGGLISKELEGNESATKLVPKSIPMLFWILNKFVKNNYVDNYVTALISIEPETIIEILDSYVQTAWGMESGISHKADFEMDQYNSLTSVLNPAIILRAIQECFPEAMIETDAFPRLFGDDTEKGHLFLKQFTWLHRHAPNQSRNDGTFGSSETQGQ